MRLPLLWLHDFCDPGLEPFALATRLALTGTEVDRVHTHGVTALEHFVVGKVLESGRHPDADRLSVCLVDTGDGAPSQIVCGAPNVAAGQTVAVARPGAVMPDGTRLKKAKPWTRSGSYPCSRTHANTFGSTMPEPRISIQPVPLHR